MTRTAIALATALLFTAPVAAADLIGERSESPSVEQTVVADATQSKKPKKPKGETSDYLIVTLAEVQVTSY